MSARVVILGTGFAGLTVARALRRRRADLDIVAVNRENYTLFTPMLPEVASGSIEPRHIAEPFRSAVPQAIFVLGEIEGVDFERRQVATRHPVTGAATQLRYDHLVVALGAVSSTHGIPGADAHSFALKTLPDAIRLGDQLIEALEAASVTPDDGDRKALLTVVVVGGGFTGVEAAGELLAYLRAAGRAYRGLDQSLLRVVLVAGSDRILEQLPARFGVRGQAMLAKRGVEIVLDDEVAAVDGGGLTLKSGRRYAAKTVVWSAGVRVPGLVEHLDLAHTEHHAIQVNADFSVSGRPGVWALGDCASVPKPGGGSYPQTAQDAVREGMLLARNIDAALRGRRTRPFRYRNMGMMASLGAREGLADVLGGRMIAGFPAWLMWRAYYLSRLPGASRKARVALDWALSLPFTEDIASIR